MESQRSVSLAERSAVDETVQSDTTEKKKSWNKTEDVKPVAKLSPGSSLTDFNADMTSTQENRKQDMWLQEIRESQGNYEQEVTCGDEAGHNKRYKSCTKNPGHVQFIDVNSFRSEHLPKRYRSEQKLTDFVRAQADVTCLIKVSYVSPDRPGTFPFYKYRGRRGFSRSATGWLSDVQVYTEEYKGNNWYRPCKCQTCQQSGEPRSEWAEVKITTASHVVFDEREAESCKCYFFYDNTQQKLTDCPLLTGHHLHQVRSNSNDDVSEIDYYTHDLVLVRKVQDMYEHYLKLCKDLSSKYNTIHDVANARAAEEKDDDKNKDDKTQVELLSVKDKDNGTTGHGVQDHLSHGEDDHQENSDDEKDNVSESHDGDKKHTLVVITSHPHGCSKMVTLGQVTHRHDKDDILTSYEYSTATCPGSSGAPVFVLGWKYGGTYHPHSGHVRGQGSQQINHSGVYLDNMW